MSFKYENPCAMPTVAWAGVIVLNTTQGGNEIILLNRTTYRRTPFDTRASPVYTALLEAWVPWWRSRGVVSAHRPPSLPWRVQWPNAHLF